MAWQESPGGWQSYRAEEEEHWGDADQGLRTGCDLGVGGIPKLLGPAELSGI